MAQEGTVDDALAAVLATDLEMDDFEFARSKSTFSASSSSSSSSSTLSTSPRPSSPLSATNVRRATGEYSQLPDSSDSHRIRASTASPGTFSPSHPSSSATIVRPSSPSLPHAPRTIRSALRGGGGSGSISSLPPPPLPPAVPPLVEGGVAPVTRAPLPPPLPPPDFHLSPSGPLSPSSYKATSDQVPSSSSSSSSTSSSSVLLPPGLTIANSSPSSLFASHSASSPNLFASLPPAGDPPPSSSTPASLSPSPSASSTLSSSTALSSSSSNVKPLAGDSSDVSLLKSPSGPMKSKPPLNHTNTVSCFPGIRLHVVEDMKGQEVDGHKRNNSSGVISTPPPPPENEEDTQTTESDAISLFNESYKKGIKLLIELGVVKESPESIATYLHETKGLDKRSIGDYLGEREPFILEVLHCFIGRLDFSKDNFEKALRKLLFCFRLPGESQKIERIMETFAEIFTQQTPLSLFKHSDTVFVLAYSTIMLNTDLHNPQVKNKMTLEQFISNNKGINQGEDLPGEFLSELYNNILEDEIKMEGEESFPNALKKGFLGMEAKQAYGIGKPKRTKRYFVLDEDLCLHQFKTIRDEASVALATLSLKDGITVERRVDDESDKKKEYIFTLYQTLTPEDTLESVISGGWKLIAPSAKVFEEWISVLENNAMCIVTSHPPTVGVRIDDEEIAPMNHRLKDSAAQIAFLQRNLLQMCQQMNSLSTEYRDMSIQLKDFERRVQARDPRSEMVDCLSLVSKTLGRIHKYSVELENELIDSVRQPLIDLSNAEVCGGKEKVRVFIESSSQDAEVKEKLKREIQAQSTLNKADPQRFQKLFAESQRLEKQHELTRSLTREVLGDTMNECDERIVSSFYRMIRAYHTFFTAGAGYMGEILSNAEENIQSRKESSVEPLKSLDSFQTNIKVIRTGTLYKQGAKRKEWVPYYFSLKRKYLYFFESYARNLNFKGSIVLRNASVIPITSKGSKQPNQFAVCTALRTDYFAANSADECKAWMDDIEKCIVNDEGFIKKDVVDEGAVTDDITESFKKQQDLISNKKKHLVKLQMTQNLREKSGGTSGGTQDMYLDDADIIKQGTLYKRGEKVKNWTQRWFVLKTNLMHYYEVLVSGELRLRGTIHLIQASVGHSEREFRSHCFEIQLQHRTYYISAKDEEEEKEWIEAILRSTTSTTPFIPNDKMEKAEGESETIKDADTRKLQRVLSSGDESLFKRSSSRSIAPATAPPVSLKKSSDVKKTKANPMDSKVPSRSSVPLDVPDLEGVTMHVDDGDSDKDPSESTSLSSEKDATKLVDIRKSDGGEVKKVGYLIKKGGMRKNWTTRYFVLRHNTLSYHKSPNEAAKGVIVLEPSSKVANAHDKKSFSFTVSQAVEGTREYWLAAADAKEHVAWMEAVEGTIRTLKEEDERK